MALTPGTWKNIHNRILVMTRDGETEEFIAKKVRTSDRTVRRIRAQALFKVRLSAVQESVDSKVIERLAAEESSKALLDRTRFELLHAALAAARKVKKIMKSGTSKDRTQLDAAKDILDRVGLKPKEVIETHERAYTPEEVAGALETTKELEAVIVRLTQTESRFVIPKEDTSTLESSVTDSSSLSDTPDVLIEDDIPSPSP